MPTGRARAIGRALSAAVVLASLAIAPHAFAGDDAPAAPAGADRNVAFDAEVVAASAPFLPELDKLGQWCNDSTLMARRAQVAEAMILLAPDNERGRGWLRFKRQADGTWKQTSSKPFFDDKPEVLPEWEKRRAPLAERMRAAFEPLIARREDWRTAGARMRLLRALVAIDVEDRELHDRAGECLAGKKWILKESAATAAGRKRIRDAVSAASADAVTAAKDMKQGTSAIGTTFGTAEFTVQSALTPGEVRDLAMRVFAARRLYERVLDVHVSFRPGFVVSVFPTHDSAMLYVATRKEMSPEQRKFADGCTTFWVARHETVVCNPRPDERVDECVRQVLSSLVGTPKELFVSPSWIGEGAGMYLTYVLVGTRLSPFITATKYADESLHKDVADPKCDWVQAIRTQVLDKSVAPKLRLLTGLPLNSMTPDDTLMAYALAAYFLEGRPADLLRILEALKSGAPFHQALADVCDVDADELEVRFVRWLRETK